MFIKPISDTTSEITDKVIKETTRIVRLMLSKIYIDPETGRYAEKESESESSSEQNNVSNDSENKVDDGSPKVSYPNELDLSLPLEDRALIPLWSGFPTEDMTAIYKLESHGSDAGGYGGVKRSSESVTYAFIAQKEDTAGLFYELEAEILHNPYVGDMIAQGLVQFYPDETWLQEFKAKTDAAFEIPYGTEPRGLEIWYTAYKFSDNQIGVYVTDEYRGIAEKLCEFLKGFENLGVMEKTAIVFYSNGVQTDISNMRALRQEGEMSPEALILKDGELTVGFDLNDKGLLMYR